MKENQEKIELSSKAVLLSDNAPVHPTESKLVTADGSNFVYYLLPNVTSLIQPTDQEVIVSVKRSYVQEAVSPFLSPGKLC